MVLSEKAAREVVVKDILIQDLPAELQQAECEQAFNDSLSALAKRSELQDPTNTANGVEYFPPLTVQRTVFTLPEHLRGLVDSVGKNIPDETTVNVKYKHQRGITTEEMDYHAFEVGWQTGESTEIILFRIQPGLDVFDTKPKAVNHLDDEQRVRHVLPYVRLGLFAEYTEMQRSEKKRKAEQSESSQDYQSLLEDFITVLNPQ